MLLSAVCSIGFRTPVEGATHLHFDATSLCSVKVFANLVNLLWTHGEDLKRLVETNSNCRRLGIWLSRATKYSQRRDSNSFSLAKFLASKSSFATR